MTAALSSASPGVCMSLTIQVEKLTHMTTTVACAHTHMHTYNDDDNGSVHPHMTMMTTAACTLYTYAHTDGDDDNDSSVHTMMTMS